MTRTVNMPDSVSTAMNKLDAFFTKAFWVSAYFSVGLTVAIYVLVFGLFVLNLLGIPHPLA